MARGTRLGLAALAALALAGVVTVADLVDWKQRGDVLPEALPSRVQEGGFVSRETCAVCHPGQAASHDATYHRTMTQPATGEAVVGSFEGQRLEDRGRAFVVRRSPGGFFVDEVAPRDEPGGGATVSTSAASTEPMASHQIVMTTGSHHQQVYWFRSGDGSLRQFPWVWLVAEARWIPNADSFLVDPRWAGRGSSGRWDANCYRCHTTGWSRPGEGTDRVSVGDFGIACEACHGPGEAHVRANRNPLRRWSRGLSGSGDPTIIHPGKVDNRRSAAVCAQCHSESFVRAGRAGGDPSEPFRAGESHEASFMARAPLELSRVAADREASRPRIAGAFWPDGTGRVAGREYTAMMLSDCYLSGEMSCVSCHSMHDAPPDKQVRPDRTGDAACTSCHGDIVDRLREHTRHEPESSGSRCLNCHMPRVTYGLFAARANHRFDSPAADGAGRRDRPNACNLCHLDRSLAWTAEWLEAWYDIPAPDLPDLHREVAAGVAWALRGDAAQRAVAAWHLGWEAALEVSGDEWTAPVLAHLLKDPYAAIRFMAGRSLFGDGSGAERYDFVADEEARDAVAREVLADWRSRREHRGARPTVLIDEGGDLDLDRFRALAAERDDTPVGITE